MLADLDRNICFLVFVACSNRRRKDARMRNQKLTLVIFFVCLLISNSAWAQGQASFTVAPVGSAILNIDTKHSQGNKFEFDVTNNGTSLDYITIQRGSIRLNNQDVLAISTPEYGISVVPGGTARMRFRWDLSGPSSVPGTVTVNVIFKSELTGATVTSPVTLVVTSSAVVPPVNVSGTVMAADGSPISNARLTVTDLVLTSFVQTSNIDPTTPAGSFTFQIQPGQYALVADAAGYKSRTQFVNVAAGQNQSVQFNLDPIQITVNAARVTTQVANVTSSIWTMRGSRDLSMLATAPMGSFTPSAFHGIRNGQVAWTSSFPGVDSMKSANVSQFQAIDCDVAVSSDGSYVAGMDYNGKLYMINAATGVTRWSTDRAQDKSPVYPANSPLGTGFYTCGAVAFSEDGAVLAAGGSNGWLVMLDAA